MAGLQLSKDGTKLVPARRPRRINFSTLCKSQWVRLSAIRPTTISRRYRDRVVERKLDTGDGLDGQFAFPLEENVYAWVYVYDGFAKRRKIPMDYWAVKIEDFEWEAALKVNLKK